MKMKKILFAFLFVLFSHSKAQELCVTSLIPSEASVLVSLQVGGIQLNAFDSQLYLGLNVRVMLSDFFSLNYNFNFGKGFTHLPVFGGEFWAASNLGAQNNDLCVILFLMALPEGFSFHIPVHEKATISPYVNVLGTEIFGSGYYGESAQFYRGAYNVGTFVVFNLNGLLLSPFVEYGGLYKYNVRNFRFGGAIGFIL